MQWRLFIAYSTCVLIYGALTPAAFGQHKVDPRNTHERLLCIVPLVGAGTALQIQNGPCMRPFRAR